MGGRRASYPQAMAAQRQAEKHVAAREYESAVQVYGHALALYAEAIVAVEHERQLQTVNSARQQMTEGRESAHAVNAEQYVGPAWCDVEQIVIEAQQCEAQGHFTTAIAQYQQAAQRFIALRGEAVTQALYQKATVAQQQTQAVKAQGAVLQEWAPSLWKEAEVLETQAEQALRDRGYEQAAQAYLVAEQTYQRAKAHAEAERRRQEEQRRAAAFYRRTESARQAADNARQQAEEAEAQTYAHSLYSQAIALHNNAEDCWRRQLYEQAVGTYPQAQRIFTQARDVARDEALRREAEIWRRQLQKARQVAEPVRTKTRTLYTELQQSRGDAVFPERFAEAADALAGAERAWAREEFAAAQKSFDQTFRRLQQLTQDIIRKDQRDKAEQAKMCAQDWQQKVKPATSEEQRGANNAFAEGERYFQQGKYQEARGQYERAASLWAILLQQITPLEGGALAVSAETLDTPTVILPSAQKQVSVSRINPRYVFLGATLLLLLVALYRLNWFHLSVDTTESTSREKRHAADEQQFPVTDSKDRVSQFPPSVDRTNPVLPFPTIIGATPNPGNEFVINEGDQQKFAIQVTSTATGPLRYVWRLNRKEQVSVTDEWIYKPNFEEGNDTIKVVEVTITDSDDQKVNQQWQGRVQNVNRTPQIQMATPPPGRVKVDAEGTQRFVIEASDLDHDDRLAIAWFLDGRKVADAKQWDFYAPPSEETHQVTVEVADAEGLKAQLAWNVEVQAQALLTLTRALPDPACKLTIDEGKSLAFAVVVQGGTKGPLRYLWQLDGKPQQGDGDQWTYQPTYEDGGETPKTVGVIVTDSANHRVRQQWQIDVHDVDRPPQIQSATPRSKSLEITTNATQDFAVEAIDLDRDDHLTYAWLVNGQEVTHEKRWQFRAPSTPGTYTIVAEVSDVAGVKRQQVWEVLVKAVLPPVQPPLWTLSEPQEGRLKVQIGQVQDFSVAAEMAEGGQGNRTELRYVWTVNGETQAVREGRFRLLEANRPGMYEVVAVAIGPQGLKSIPKR